MDEHKIEHDAQALALGHLVVSFQFLESELLRIIVNCSTTGDPRAVSVLANQLSFSNLTVAFVALIEVLSRDDDIKTRTRELAGQLNQTNAGRNTFVHSHYHVSQWDLQGQSILRRKARMKIKNGLMEDEAWFDPAAIYALNEKMMKQCMDLHEIERKLLIEGVIPSFPD